MPHGSKVGRAEVEVLNVQCALADGETLVHGDHGGLDARQDAGVLVPRGPAQVGVAAGGGRVGGGLGLGQEGGRANVGM